MVKRKSKKAAVITNTTLKLNIPTGEEKVMEKQIAQLVSCGAGNLHIIVTCPRCHSVKGGLLFATVPGTFIGITTAKCTDCSEAIDYYIDAKENGIWRMEAVDIKGDYISTKLRYK